MIKNSIHGKYNKYIIDEIMPSNTLRSYYIDNHIDLTEYQLLACVRDCNQMPLVKIIKIYEEIDEQTDDHELAEYLKNEINLIGFYFRKLSERNDDQINILYTYDSEQMEYEAMGLYKRTEIAERICRRKSSQFKIERHKVKELTEEEIQHAEMQMYNDDLEDTLELIIYYNAAGKIFDIEYMKEDEEYLALRDKSSDFTYFVEKKYHDFPCPFSHGDFVRLAGIGGKAEDIGIVHVDKERIGELLKRGIIPEDELYCEFPDADGEFSHRHIPPYSLEKVSLEDITGDMKEILQSGSNLIKGKGDLDSFQYIQYNLRNGNCKRNRK